MFAKNLKYLREINNMEQLELAQILGRKSSSSISEWEKGKYTPKIGVLNDLSKIFKVDIDDLMNKDLSSSNIKNNINNVYNQLEESRQTKVYNYATQQLKEQKQTNVVELHKEEFAEDPTMVIAAHMDDDASEEEKEEVRQFIQNLKDERKNK